MKKSTLLALSFVIIFYMTQCKKDSSPSFVDDYNVPLTEEKGTKHAGDYFPLGEGFTWNYLGLQGFYVDMEISGGGYGDTISSDALEMEINNSLICGAQETINLSGSNYNLYPLSSLLSPIEQCYQKTDDGVYLRALKVFEDSYIEVENSILIKKPLIVGDSWEKSPSIKLDTAETTENMDVATGKLEGTAKCKVYVIGKETIYTEGGEIEPIRLDEVAEASFKAAITEKDASGEITINIKFVNKLYLLENVGLVKQDLEIENNSTVTASMDGEKVSMKMSFDTKLNAMLDTYDFSGTNEKRVVKVTDNMGNMLDIKGNPFLEKAAKKVVEATNIARKIVTF
jgi:hypothetical protein